MESMGNTYKLGLSYLGVALFVFCVLSILPLPGGYTWEPAIINTLMTLMFVLLVFLTARLARTNKTATGILLTTLYIMLFNPGIDYLYVRDDEGLMSLASQCIVPFFIKQYTRIRRKDFNKWYVLMLLMGIFCSYTHNGIAIPLCATFLWMSFRHFHGFFGKACWPMVVGFAIGTTLSILSRTETDTLAEMLPNTIGQMPLTTWHVLTTLWDTKVFVISVGLTGYLFYNQSGRTMLRRIARRHYAICCCLLFSLITIPLAPLGIDNAVEGICFFCMFWLLFVTRYLAERYWNWKI